MSPAMSERTIVQFRLRSLFVATPVVAVLSAIAAPWVRRLQPWQQARLAVFLGITLVFTGLFVIDLCGRRRRVERLSGRLLSQDAADWWRWLYQPALYAQWAAAYAVYILWWKLDPPTIEAREKGLILGGRRFLPWDRIQRYRWGVPSPAHLTLYLHQYVVNRHVSPPDKQRLDQLAR